MHRRMVLAMALATALGGCSLFGDDDETVERGPLPTDIDSENVQAVQRLEIGRSRGGLMLTAFGTARGLGYSKPRLVARRGGSPATDGMLDYDFVVDTPPRGIALPPGSAKARSVRADIEVPVAVAQQVRGVRVHAVAGGVQMLF